jgi:hypothetical protein
VRYPSYRLRALADGNPWDWDDNEDPRKAVEELERRAREGIQDLPYDRDEE